MFVSECGCNTDGSIDNLCDKYTGQCSCHDNVIGVKCSECEPGYYGFPNCRGSILFFILNMNNHLA